MARIYCYIIPNFTRSPLSVTHTYPYIIIPSLSSPKFTPTLYFQQHPSINFSPFPQIIASSMPIRPISMTKVDDSIVKLSLILIFSILTKKRFHNVFEYFLAIV